MGLNNMEPELGEIIAKRSLRIVNRDGERSEAEVFLGKPQTKGNSKGFLATYQINYLGEIRIWYAAGVDAFQALQLAMKMINVELGVIERVNSIKISWEGDASGKLGFDDNV